MQPVRALFAAVSSLVAALPRDALPGFGRALGWLVGSVARVRRREVVERMHLASIVDAERCADAMYASLGTGLLELLAISDHTRSIESLVDLTPRAREVFDRVRGRGAIIATAHSGCWDLVGCAMAELAPISVLTKRLHVGALDRVWQASRVRRGLRLIDASGALASARDALARGELVVCPIDQAPERDRGVVVHPFLGRDALHDTAPATIAARLGVPFVLALGRRVGDVHVLDVRLVDDTPTRGLKGDEARAWIELSTRAAADALGEYVREDPAQWLWLHRRWKGVPMAAHD